MGAVFFLLKIKILRQLLPWVKKWRDDRLECETKMKELIANDKKNARKHKKLWMETKKKHKMVNRYLAHLIMFDLFAVSLENSLECIVLFYIRYHALTNTSNGNVWDILMWLKIITSLFFMVWAVAKAFGIRFGFQQDALNTDLKPTNVDDDDDEPVYVNPFDFRFVMGNSKPKLPPIEGVPDPNSNDSDTDISAVGALPTHTVNLNVVMNDGKDKDKEKENDDSLTIDDDQQYTVDVVMKGEEENDDSLSTDEDQYTLNVVLKGELENQHEDTVSLDEEKENDDHDSSCEGMNGYARLISSLNDDELDQMLSGMDTMETPGAITIDNKSNAIHGVFSETMELEIGQILNEMEEEDYMGDIEAWMNPEMDEDRDPNGAISEDGDGKYDDTEVIELAEDIMDAMVHDDGNSVERKRNSISRRISQIFEASQGDAYDFMSVLLAKMINNECDDQKEEDEGIYIELQ
eukprot:466506_1